MLAEQMANRPELDGEVFNFSNERKMTVSDLVGRILETMHSNLDA